jgi:hypothetical protein
MTYLRAFWQHCASPDVITIRSCVLCNVKVVIVTELREIFKKHVEGWLLCVCVYL